MKKKVRKKKVLVIIAHPDDETIWMGGTLLMNKDKWDTTIISLCRKDDPDRAPKFARVCRILKARCFISDLEDEKLNEIKAEEIIKRIKQFIDGKSYGYIFTHGLNGEYGHKRHIDVHKAVVKMLNARDLIAKEVLFFSYTMKGAFCCPNKNSDKFIKLKDVCFMKKKYLIKGIYRFKQNSFEDMCSKNKETFKVKEKI